MKLSNALALLTPPEKTAAAAPSVSPAGPPASSDVAASELRQVIKEATAGIADEAKTAAAASSPIDDLTKLATDLIGSEHEATAKEAQLYGAAVCDGFMARLAQYNAAAESLPAPVKTAAAPAAEGDTFEKFASMNPNLVREAYDLGYETTRRDLVKLAEASWTHGHNSTVRWIHKTASNAFVNGFADTLKLLEASR